MAEAIFNAPRGIQPGTRQSGGRMVDSAGIDEHRIVTALEANIIEADTIEGSEVSEQRQRNHEYYALDGLGNEKENRSHHQSADVLDTVESVKSFFMEAFAANRRPIKFHPEGQGDNTFRLSTEYALDLFFEDNDGWDFIRDSLHDAFIAKRCVAVMEWKEEFEEKMVPFDGPVQQLDALLQREEVIGVEEYDIYDTQQSLVRARVIIDQDVSYPDLMLITPEKYFRDPNVAYVRDAAFAGWQDDFQRHELITMGFDEDEVTELRLDYRFRQNEEEASRKAHDSTWARQRRHKRNPEQEIVTLYCTYAHMDLSSYIYGGRDESPTPSITETKLYKFYWSQGKLLTNPKNGEKWEEIPNGKMPFYEWTQYKISHAEYGLCDADLTASLQWDKSNLRRLLIDNQAMANTSRWKARQNFIKNPRELMENRIGSVIWVKDMDSLEPLETPPLSPVSFQLEEKFDQEKENRSGMSRLAKGMSSEVVSNQNADSMIQRLTNASNRRILRQVRDYANTFLRPILTDLHNMGVRYDTQPRNLEIGGQIQPIFPYQLPMRKKMKCSAALTPDEGREEAMFLLSMHERMIADPELAVLYGLDKRYQLFSDVFDAYGYADSSNYMAAPQDPQVQAIKRMQAQMEQMQKDMANMETQIKVSDLQRKWTETQNEIADTASDNLRRDEEFDFDMQKFFLEFAEQKRMNDAEIEIEKSQTRPASIGN